MALETKDTLIHARGRVICSAGRSKEYKSYLYRLWEVGGFAECVYGHFFLLYIIYKIKRVDSSVETMV